MSNRYLFFDIECADGNYAICEYGFVLTDERFNVLQAKNYIMNPKTSFNLSNRPGRVDLPLSYPMETYLKAGLYEDFYENIKFLMTQKDLVIFGHSVSNDIHFLVKANKRYLLPQFDYVAYDIQNMFSYFDSSRNKFISLDHAVEKLVPEEEKRHLISHRAVDDAFMSMLELKSMANFLEFNVQDMIDICPTCKHTVEEVIKSGEVHKMKIKRKYVPKGNPDGQAIWRDFNSECRPLLEKEESIGKICTLSSTIKRNAEMVSTVTEKMRKDGWVAFNQIIGADFLIVQDDEDKKRLKEVMKDPFNGKMITLEDFLK